MELNTVMTVVNSVSKITYFIPTHTTVSIEGIRLFLYMLYQIKKSKNKNQNK